MQDTKKIRRAASVLLVIVGAISLFFLVGQIKDIFFNLKGVSWNALTIAGYAVGFIITFVSFVLASFLLYSIRRDDTPFNRKNVIRLKLAALLLCAIELYLFLSQRILSGLYPIILDDNTALAVMPSSTGGIVLAAGLVVYCIALVFDYGVSLQRQVDETL